MTKNSFSIMPRVLAHFGDELIRNEIIALTELVKNAYDANAKKCDVTFYFNPNKANSFKPYRIDIIDNGDGMSEVEIKEHWLTVGTDNKKLKIEATENQGTGKRVPLGEKGIGRFGVHKLGKTVVLKTKKESTSSKKLVIKWKKLDEAKTLADFNFEIKTDPKGFGEDKGVSLTILDIKGTEADWTRGKLRSIYRALTALNINFSEKDCRLIDNSKVKSLIQIADSGETTTSDEFLVSATAHGKVGLFSGLLSFDKIKESALYECDMLLEGQVISDFEYNFNPWASIANEFHPRKVVKKQLSTVECQLQRKKEKNEAVENVNKLIKDKKNLGVDLGSIGPVYVKFYAFEQDAAISHHLQSKDSVRKYLKENCGVRVYRNGVRVYDYGEPGNDWLGLRSVGSIGEKLRNEHVIGFVFLDRQKSSKLIEKTNREGFVENAAYKNFVYGLQWAVNHVFLQRRNSDKRRLSEFYSSTTEPVIHLLDETKQYIDKHVKDEDNKKVLTGYVYKIQKEYKSIVDTLYQSAGVGILSSSIVHEIEKIIKAINYSFETGEDVEQTRVLVRSLKTTIDKFSFLIKKTDIKEISPDSIFNHALRFVRLRFSAHSIELLKNGSMKDIKCKASLNHATNVLLNIMDNSIYWLNQSRDEGKKISVIFTTQYLDGFFSIIVADNGTGFPESPELLVRPFVSTKPFAIGSGLGLYIADELMRGMGGTLTFPESTSVIDLFEGVDIETKAIVALNFPQ